MRALHILTVLGAVIGGFQLLNVEAVAASAPQQAAGAALAVAWTVIPYCFARAIIAMCSSPEQAELKKLNETLATHTRLLATLANTAPPPEFRCLTCKGPISTGQTNCLGCGVALDWTRKATASTAP